MVETLGKSRVVAGTNFFPYGTAIQRIFCHICGKPLMTIEILSINVHSHSERRPQPEIGACLLSKSWEDVVRVEFASRGAGEMTVFGFFDAAWDKARLSGKTKRSFRSFVLWVQAAGSPPLPQSSLVRRR